MKQIIFLSLCLTSMGSWTTAFSLNPYPEIKLDARSSKVAGEPLILTPFLMNGSIAQARTLSQVSLSAILGVKSHAGFFTVNPNYNSNLYFWYFPAMSRKADAPVVLWLQGGPGGSSLFGLFTELGPLITKKDGFALRKYHWALDYNLIFIDNPVGTGFSFTDNDEGYCNNEECIGSALYNAMQQFFTLFPKLRANDFYIAGESYAGKYIAALAMQIYMRNARPPARVINLKGIAIGNGYCDPINQMDYGKYLYQYGLIDENQKNIFETKQQEVVRYIKNKQWLLGYIAIDTLIGVQHLNNFSYFNSFTGFNNFYNILKAKDNSDMTALTALFSNVHVRRSVHVGDRPFNDDGTVVKKHLANDFLQTVAPYFKELLSNYRVLLYNGQLDVIVAYPLTVNFIKNLNFSSAEEYKTAKRSIWRVNNEIAGYYKVAGNLTEVLVRNAGHMVPKDQPKWALNMISKFINKKFTNVNFGKL